MKDHLQDHLNNSNEDYLWDRSGASDPEIEKLEKMLGTLRYQPRPLAIPDGLEISRSSFRRFGARLAVAATILVALGAGVLWFSVGTKKQFITNNSHKAAAALPDDVIKEIPAKDPAAVPGNAAPDPSVAVSGRGSTPAGRQVTIRRNRTNQIGPMNERLVHGSSTPVLGANELKEAEEGKARLMLALRFASTKLNVALKKAQGTSNRNLMHNQHRIG